MEEDLFDRFNGWNLAEVASEATIELDNYRLGRSKETGSIKKLAESMRKFGESEENSLSARMMTTDIFSKYFYGKRLAEFPENQKIRLTHSDVREGFVMMAEELSNFQNLSPDGLKDITALCLDISKTAANYFQYYNPDGFTRYVA